MYNVLNTGISTHEIREFHLVMGIIICIVYRIVICKFRIMYTSSIYVLRTHLCISKKEIKINHCPVVYISLRNVRRNLCTLRAALCIHVSWVPAETYLITHSRSRQTRVTRDAIFIFFPTYLLPCLLPRYLFRP